MVLSVKSVYDVSRLGLFTDFQRDSLCPILFYYLKHQLKKYPDLVIIFPLKNGMAEMRMARTKNETYSKYSFS